MPLVPALTDIGAAGLLAHRVQPVRAYDLPGVAITPWIWAPPPDPIGLLQRRQRRAAGLSPDGAVCWWRRARRSAAAPRLTYGRRAAGARRPVLASARHIAGRHGTGIVAHIPYQGKARLGRILHISDRSLRSQYVSRLTSPGGRRARPPRPSLTLRRRMNAPPAKVYEAWTDAKKISHWFGPRERRSIARYDGRARRRALPYRPSWTRRRGTRRGRHLPRGGAANESWYSLWAWRTTPERESLVTIALRRDGEGTLLTLMHEQFADEAARDRHARGWNGTLDKARKLCSRLRLRP